MDTQHRVLLIFQLKHPRYICVDADYIMKIYLPLEWDKFKDYYKRMVEQGYGIVEMSRFTKPNYNIEFFQVFFGPLGFTDVPRLYVSKLSDYAPLSPQPGYQEVVEETFGQFTYRTVHKVQGGKFRTRANRI